MTHEEYLMKIVTDLIDSMKKLDENGRQKIRTRLDSLINEIKNDKELWEKYDLVKLSK